MNERTCLITGATAGIGKEAALALAAKGLRIVLVSRDRGRGEKARDEIRHSAAGTPVELIIGDLGSQESIRKMAADFEGRFDRLDVLINNAGAWYPERTWTIDGIEATFATNHLAYFLLTGLLTPLLKRSAPSRIVNVASEAHRWARTSSRSTAGCRFVPSVSYHSEQGGHPDSLIVLLGTSLQVPYRPYRGRCVKPSSPAGIPAPIACALAHRIDQDLAKLRRAEIDPSRVCFREHQRHSSSHCCRRHACSGFAMSQHLGSGLGRKHQVARRA
jgi:NAD(P)-dependent dehydrogenase (short-subunit alcohol dehydrogenase family)